MFRQLLRLSKHSFIYGLGAVASQIIGFLLLPLYTRYLTPADYGILEIFSVTTTILAIIVGMGLISGLYRSFFDYEEQGRRAEVVSTALLFLGAACLCSCLLLIALASNFSLLLFNSTQYTFYFRVIFLTIFFNTTVAIPMAVFRVQQQSKRYVMFFLLRVLAGIGLNIYFIIVLKKGVLGILGASLISAFLLWCILMPGLIKSIGFRFSKSELKKMLAFGLPLVPGNLAAWIMTVGDRFFLQFLSTPHELGLYSLGYKFGIVVQALVVGPFTLAWSPFLFSMAKEKNAKEVYSSVLTYFSLVAVFVALGISVLPKEVLLIMATPPFYGAYKVIPLIALSYVFSGCYWVLGAGLNLARKTKYVPLIVGVGAVVNLGLNYLLIPSYGMMGAAVATVISYLLLPIGSYFVSRRYYPIKYEWGRVAKIVVAAGLVYVGCLFIRNDSAIIAGLLKLLSLLAFPLLLFAFRFFKPEEIQKTKEVFRAAPGYVRLRLAKKGLFWRKK